MRVLRDEGAKVRPARRIGGLGLLSSSARQAATNSNTKPNMPK